MDFKDLIKQLGERILKLKEQIQTEEATKNAFIMPFIQALGYDVFNPLEVVPEHTCDIGTKKGEKVDYAILKENQPILLIECKHWRQELNLHDNQLLRYFGVSKAKFGLLTNGIVYRFYTDLEKQNVMDNSPFLDFDITEIKDNQIEELKKFHKSYFDENNILGTAADLKYTNEFKNLLILEMQNPSENFVKHFSKQVFNSPLTTRYIEYFTPILKKSFNLLVSDLITERLKTAISNEEQKEATEISEVQSASETKNAIITTEEELEGYYIVKTLLREYVDASRISYKDTLSYFAIILDDNIRKTICRLYFNTQNKYIAVFDESKNENKIQISKLDDIYSHKEILIKMLNSYLSK